MRQPSPLATCNSFLPHPKWLAFVGVSVLMASCWSATASASCGDYVWIDGKPIRELQAFGAHRMGDLGTVEQFQQQQSDSYASDSYKSDSHTPTPCSQGRCHQSPLPFAPASTPAMFSFQKVNDAICSQRTGSCEQETSTSSSDLFCRSLVGFPMSVLRPPQIASL